MGHAKARSLIIRFLDAFFTQLYHHLAWSYDLVASVVSLGRWNKWIQAVYPYITEGRILELGFGPGHLQLDFAVSGRSIIGIDESPQMCRIAKRRLVNANYPPVLARANAIALPFPTQNFDCVVATFPSPYIFQQSTLSEIYRVLRPTGTLIVLLAAQPQGQSFADRLIGLLFKITGEAPPPEETLQRIKKYFHDSSLSVHYQWLQVQSDRLLLITASPLSTNSHGTLDLSDHYG